MPLTGAMREKVRHHIDTHGQHLRRVLLKEGDPDDALPFVYTIGNHERGLPELLLIGFVEPNFLSILNRLGEIQRERKIGFRHAELVDLGGTFPVRIVDAGAVGRDKYAVQVSVFYGTDDYQVRQVLISDRAGRFPDDPECDAPYRSQPVLSSGILH